MDAYHYGVSQGCSEETRLFLLGLIIDYFRERFAQGDSFCFSSFYFCLFEPAYFKALFGFFDQIRHKFSCIGYFMRNFGFSI